MQVYHNIESEEKGRVLPRFKEQYASKKCMASNAFSTNFFSEAKFNNDKFAGHVEHKVQGECQFLGRKRKAWNWDPCKTSMKRLARAHKKPFEQTFEEAKQVCEPHNANIEKPNIYYQFKVPTGTLSKDPSFLKKTPVYRKVQVPNRNSSRLVHQGELLYPPFQSARNLARSIPMHAMPRAIYRKHCSAPSANIGMGVLAQAIAIDVPSHLVSLVAEKPISPPPKPFPAFALNGKPTNTKNHRLRTKKIQHITYDDICHQQNAEPKRNTQIHAPWHRQVTRPFVSIHDICKNILDDAKNHLCEMDYLKLLVLLGEVWNVTKGHDSDVDGRRREKLVYVMTKIKQLLRGGPLLQAIKTLVKENLALAWVVEDW